MRTTDNTGFIVNRLLVPYLLDAVRVLEQGVASIEDIDNSMKLGCGYPMGPLTLLDFVGIDTTYYIANIMFDEFKEPRFAAPPLLKRMVLAGWNGRKAGRGFYDYADPANPKPMQLGLSSFRSVSEISSETNETDGIRESAAGCKRSDRANHLQPSDRSERAEFQDGGGAGQLPGCVARRMIRFAS